MTKRNTIFKTFLLTFFLFLMCSSCFMLTACNDEPKSNITVYKLYQLEIGDSNYELGDDLFGMTLKKEFCTLTLNKDKTAEFKLNRGLESGDVAYKHLYSTIVGTYSETDTEVNVTFDNSSKYFKGIKANNLITITIEGVKFILKK